MKKKTVVQATRYKSAPVHKPLQVHKLRWQCDPKSLGIKSTNDIHPTREIIGQTFSGVFTDRICYDDDNTDFGTITDLQAHGVSMVQTETETTIGGPGSSPLLGQWSDILECLGGNFYSCIPYVNGSWSTSGPVGDNTFFTVNGAKILGPFGSESVYSSSGTAYGTRFTCGLSISDAPPGSSNYNLYIIPWYNDTVADNAPQCLGPFAGTSGDTYDSEGLIGGGPWSTIVDTGGFGMLYAVEYSSLWAANITTFDENCGVDSVLVSSTGGITNNYQEDVRIDSSTFPTLLGTEYAQEIYPTAVYPRYWKLGNGVEFLISIQRPNLPSPVQNTWQYGIYRSNAQPIWLFDVQFPISNVDGAGAGPQGAHVIPGVTYQNNPVYCLGTYRLVQTYLETTTEIKE